MMYSLGLIATGFRGNCKPLFLRDRKGTEARGGLLPTEMAGTDAREFVFIYIN